MDDILVFEKVCASYSLGDANIDVLHHVDLRVSAQSHIALMAPSGSGKSTLLHIAGLLMRPSQGEVFLCNQATSNLNEHLRCRLRAQAIGFVFQAHFLMEEFSVLENVVLPMQLTNILSQNPYKRATFLLERVGLAERLHHRPGQLSGGERQRVAVARALALKPRLLLADEPTGSLDEENSTALIKLLLEISQEEHFALMVVTHDLNIASYMQTQWTLSKRQLVVEHSKKTNSKHLSKPTTLALQPTPPLIDIKQ